MGKQGENGISWTEQTWNPITGCTKVSEGCAHCYAERYAKRGIGDFKPERKPIPGGSAYIGRSFSDVKLHPSRLEQPRHWKKPRKIFVCNMGDMFHEAVPDGFIDKVFAVIALCPQHTFQVLTKRAERMVKYLINHAKTSSEDAAETINGKQNRWNPWPLQNVWLGVSCENQDAADERIPLLLQTPAAVRFVSVEPMLGPVDFGLWAENVIQENGDIIERKFQVHHSWFAYKNYPGIDWVIIGSESGPGARTMKIEWAQDLVAQCKAAGVPVHVKQIHVNGKLSKNMDEWPKDLRVREFPEVINAL
jgi:protein gp37